MEARDICAIIAAGKKANALQIEYNGFKISYKNDHLVEKSSQPRYQIIAPEANESKSEPEQPHSELSLEDLIITDPEKFEEKLLSVE